mgnify:FL=1
MSADNKIVKIVKLINGDENLKDLMRYNLMTHDIEFIKKTPWQSNGLLKSVDLTELKYYLARVHDREFPTYTVEEGTLICARQNLYNPLLDWLKSLKWDGIKRLDGWLCDLAGVKENCYIRDVSRKILCGAVKRIFEPGCKFDYMPILEGEQGTGKSTLLSILGGKWYLDTHLSTSENKKEIVDAMRTAWIVEISDLAGFRKHDIEYLKSFLSDESDRVRLPYARRAEDYPRQCVFIGTHNPSGDNEYLRDDTGNRRFWPVECSQINLQHAKECRDQLFAEAVIKYKEGETLYIDNKESLHILDSMHKTREVDTPLNSIIGKYLYGKNMVSNQEIIERAFALNPGKMTYLELRSKCTAIGIFMRRIKWIKGENKKRGWYFKPGYEYSEVEEMKVYPEDAEPISKKDTSMVLTQNILTVLKQDIPIQSNIVWEE